MAYSDEEQKFMYRIGYHHLTVFCIIFVWPGSRPSPVRIMTKLDPSGSKYLPFIVCYAFVSIEVLMVFSGF